MMAFEDNYHALFYAVIYSVFFFNLFQALFQKITGTRLLIWEPNANNFDNVINFVRDMFVKRIFCV